eukprot:scaffold1141_cov369-Prasinococcus_capsulatus_cf.AAC.5
MGTYGESARARWRATDGPPAASGSRSRQVTVVPGQVPVRERRERGWHRGALGQLGAALAQAARRAAPGAERREGRGCAGWDAAGARWPGRRGAALARTGHSLLGRGLGHAAVPCPGL